MDTTFNRICQRINSSLHVLSANLLFGNSAENRSLELFFDTLRSGDDLYHLLRR